MIEFQEDQNGQDQAKSVFEDFGVHKFHSHPKIWISFIDVSMVV